MGQTTLIANSMQIKTITKYDTNVLKLFRLLRRSVQVKEDPQRYLLKFSAPFISLQWSHNEEIRGNHLMSVCEFFIASRSTLDAPPLRAFRRRRCGTQDRVRWAIEVPLWSLKCKFHGEGRHTHSIGTRVTRVLSSRISRANPSRRTAT